MNEAGALQGIRVLDMGRVIAAPFAAAMLADMGADVIKIEVPGRGDDARDNLPKKDGESTYYINFNRSKRGITLDLKKGKEIFFRLLKEADVVLENFRPGVMEKLGFSYEELRKVKPNIIVASISGFGQSGPYSSRAGYDPVAQAMSGIMSVTGWKDAPPTRCGASLTDVMAAMNAVIGILAALRHRDMTGTGQYIDIALVDSAVVAMSSVNLVHLTDDVVPQRMGNGYVAGAPGGCYPAKDGDVVTLALGEPLWRRLANAMEMPQLTEDPRFRDNDARSANRDELDAVISGWSRQYTVQELTDRLLGAGLPAGPVLNVKQVAEDPHIAGVRQMFIEVEHPVVGKVKITNQAIKMSKTPPHVRGCAPTLGQHTEEVLCELGYSADEIAQLSQQGII